MCFPEPFSPIIIIADIGSISEANALVAAKSPDMANMLKVAHSAVSKYESAKIEPSLSQTMIIADFFGVTMDQIIKQDLSKGAE